MSTLNLKMHELFKKLVISALFVCLKEENKYDKVCE